MIARRSSLFAGMRVLELGSGLGLPGLLAAKLGAQSVILTDCLPRVLENLQRTVKLNELASVASAHMLDWVAENGLGFNAD